MRQTEMQTKVTNKVSGAKQGEAYKSGGLIQDKNEIPQMSLITNSQQTHQYVMLRRNAAEAPAILKRDIHLFKVGTIYVVDKLNFNLQKLLRYREQEIAQSKKISESQPSKVAEIDYQISINLQKDENKEALTNEQDIIIEEGSNGGEYHRQKEIILPVEEKSPAGQNTQINEETIQKRELKVQTYVRGSSAPIKNMHPSHFKHGSRMNKHCIVCEGLVKPLTQIQQLNSQGGPAEQLAAIQNPNVPPNNLKEIVKQNSFIPNLDDQSFSERRMSFKSIEGSRIALQDYSKAPSSIAGDANSERGFMLDNIGVRLLLEQDLTPKVKQQNNNKHDENVPSFSKQTSVQEDTKNKEPLISNVQPSIPLESNNGQAEIQEEQQNPQKSSQSTAQTMRDGDIEQYQRRRIRLSDFIQGQPSMKLMFSKHVRKFNRELLKATCLVIGCKRMYANKIAEKVFDEFDQILNNLSENLDFAQHFDINFTQVSSTQQDTPSLKKNEENKQIQEKSSRRIEPDSRKHITTITVSAPLFKYVLKKYLSDKYKYSKPEYLKDFYVASDLVQSKRNILVLLAGTSGTGKSTLSSLLGSRLGISTVISTDTIRHVMRNFVAKEDDPIIFASTYETHQFVSEDIQSKKKRTLQGYKTQCYKVQQELEKVIDAYQRRNESLVVEGVHLTVRFMLNMMKKYPSCIPFIICITNEDKHKERFAVRTKHMTIDPKFNKYIKNVQSIRTIQKHLIKKAEAALIPRIDNSNIDKSIGLIHATIVRCLRQIAEGTPIFDAQRKQATIMYQEFANISKNKLSTKDAQQFIHQKVNKSEILAEYMNKANPEIEEKLKRYKKSQSMGDLNQFKKNASKLQKKSDQQEEEKTINNLPEKQTPIFQLPSGDILTTRAGNNQVNNDALSDEGGMSPRAKSVHVIMRPEQDGAKISEQEKQLIKKQLLQQDVFEDFPFEEETFGDSKAALLVAASTKGKHNDGPPKKQKKDKVFDEEEQRLRDERKRKSDQQKQIEEERYKQAMTEALKRAQLEEEEAAAQEQQQIQQQAKIQQILSASGGQKSQSMALPLTEPNEEKEDNLSLDPIPKENSFDMLEEENFDVHSQDLNKVRRQNSQNQLQEDIIIGSTSPKNLPLNIVNVKTQMKKENSKIGTTYSPPSAPPQGTSQVNSFQHNIDASTSPTTPPTRLSPKAQNNAADSELEKSMLKPSVQVTQKVEVTSDRAEEGIEDYENNNEEEYEDPINENLRSSGIFNDTNPGNIENMIEAEQIQEGYKSDSQLNPDRVHSKKILKQRHKEIDSEERKSLDPQTSGSGSFHQYAQEIIIDKSLAIDNGSNTTRNIDNLQYQGSTDSLGVPFAGSKTLKKIREDPRMKSTEKKSKLRISHLPETYFGRLREGFSGSRLSKRGHLLGSLQKSKGLKKITGVAGIANGSITAGLVKMSSAQNLPQQKQEIQAEANTINTQNKDVKKIQKTVPVVQHIDENKSEYSGSGLAPSLYSHSVNFFPQTNTADDIQSQAQGFERIEQESDESVSDDTNSQGVEASDHDVLSEEVAYSHISETDNEEDQEEDAIEKKQTSFNVQKPANPAETQVDQNTHASPEDQSSKIPSNNELGQSKSQPNDNNTGIINAFNQSTEGSVNSDPYERVKPISNKSFEEDPASINSKPNQEEESNKADDKQQ